MLLRLTKTHKVMSLFLNFRIIKIFGGSEKLASAGFEDF